MEFKVERIDVRPNKTFYGSDVLDIAYQFSKLAYSEFKGFIKSIVLFGSSARKLTEAPNDIDILIIIDDLSIVLSPEVVQTYRVLTQAMIRKISPRLHITTLKFTSFWEYVKSGDPIVINMLRDGFALVDTGVFDPLQALLLQGRLRPTPEAVWSYFVRAPSTLVNSKWHILQATVDLYWAVIDAGHAVLMRAGEIPPTPEHIADLMEEKLVKTGHMDGKYPQIVRNFYDLSKMIFHREIKEIKGEEYERYYKDASDFVREAKKFLEENKTFAFGVHTGKKK